MLSRYTEFQGHQQKAVTPCDCKKMPLVFAREQCHLSAASRADEMAKQSASQTGCDHRQAAPKADATNAA